MLYNFIKQKWFSSKTTPENIGPKPDKNKTFLEYPVDNVHNRSAIGPVSGSGLVRGGLRYQVQAINSSACTNTSSHYTYYTLSSCIFYFLVSNLFRRKLFIFLCNWELVLIWLLKSLGKHDVQLWHKIRFWKSTFKE